MAGYMGKILRVNLSNGEIAKESLDMEFAEKYEDPERYSEAAELFNEASQHFTNSKLKLLALGNSAFCQALGLGCKFDKESDTSIKAEYYPKIKSLINPGLISNFCYPDSKTWIMHRAGTRL